MFGSLDAIFSQRALAARPLGVDAMAVREPYGSGAERGRFRDPGGTVDYLDARRSP
jgi:hypothetical protein